MGGGERMEELSFSSVVCKVLRKKIPYFWDVQRMCFSESCFYNGTHCLK